MTFQHYHHFFFLKPKQVFQNNVVCSTLGAKFHYGIGKCISCIVNHKKLDAHDNPRDGYLLFPLLNFKINNLPPPVKAIT